MQIKVDLKWGMAFFDLEQEVTVIFIGPSAFDDGAALFESDYDSYVYEPSEIIGLQRTPEFDK